MAKQNCWESKNCGRGPGGRETYERGVCPAATVTAADGIHGGANGGRACWGIVGTVCAGEVQVSLSAKLRRCIECDFRMKVGREEESLLPATEIWARVAQPVPSSCNTGRAQSNAAFQVRRPQR